MIARRAYQVAIIGAGIAGLSLSILLARAGHSVTVYERRTSLKAEGAGIQITPNGAQVLRLAGVWDAVREKSYHTEILTIHSGSSGRALTHLSFGADFEKRFGAPYLVLHRQVLIESLEVAAQNSGVEIYLDQRFERVINQDRQVRFVINDEEKVADCLIGADGVWSNVRPFVSNATAHATHKIAYRALVDVEENEIPPIKNLSIWLGANSHLVAYPVSDNRRLNLVAVTRGTFGEKHISKEADTQTLESQFQNWAETVQTLIARAQTWKAWPLFTVSPQAPWTNDRLALLGDAAHAMVPFAAQGGSAALEDAAVLAHHIDRSTDISQAFLDYETARKSRVVKIYRVAQQNGQRYHLKEPFATARNLVLRTLPKDQLLDRYSWIYEWRPPQMSE